MTTAARGEMRRRSGVSGWVGTTLTLLPVWFVLGLAGFVWAAMGVIAVVQLLDRRRPLELPWWSGALVALVAWIPVSGALVVHDGVATVLLFAFRWLVVVAMAAVSALVIADPDRAAVRSMVRRAMVAVWLTCIGFGAASFLAPGLEFPSPAARLLPASFAENEYLSDITSANLSEIQTVGGVDTARPAAPFPYTNGWAAAVGLTFPFAVVALVIERRGRRRALGAITCVAGVLVSVASLNRWLWVSIGVTGVYLVVTGAPRTRRAGAAVMTAAVMVVVAVLAFTPVGDRVTDRLDAAEDSNRWRSAVIAESVEASLVSPLVGYGDPQPVDSGPPLGTHGLAWYLVYSHGWVALVLFGAWLLGAVARAARLRTPLGAAAAASLLAGLLATPVYGLIPHLPLLGLAAALAWHESGAADRPLTPEEVPRDPATI